MPLSVFPGHGQSAEHPRMPGRKTFSAILATIFMGKSRNELLSSKGNEILIFIQVCKEFSNNRELKHRRFLSHRSQPEVETYPLRRVLLLFSRKFQDVNAEMKAL